MTYALVENGDVKVTGMLPAAARHPETGELFSPPDGQWTDELAAQYNWLPVVEVAKPADTLTDTYDLSYEMIDGQPTQVWTMRPWTPAQAEDEAARVARETQRATVRAIVNDLRTEKGTLQAVLDTPNATIKADPQVYIKDVARAAKRIADASIDLAKFVKEMA